MNNLPALDESRLRRAWRWPAWLWLVVILALAVQQVGFWRSPRLDSDVLALLPTEQQYPLLAIAERRIVDTATPQIVVAIGGREWTSVRDAARMFSDSLRAESATLVPVSDEQAGTDAVSFYRPFRDRLLTPEQRRRLADSPPSDLAASALTGLYGPGISGGLTEWRADPLGLWPEWWQARIGQGITSRDGLTNVSKDGMEWAVLRFAAITPTFQLDGQAHLKTALDRAQAASGTRYPGLRFLRVGVPLHAEAAAVRASWEMNTIGWGSLLAVVLLIWLAFRGFRPLLLVAVSLAIGCAAGVEATVLVFGKIHLLTLVFGASLVGVAEDYGIHYFACRQGHEKLGPHGLMRFLLPGLGLALVTSVLAYLALGLAPFPGLRQMAVFSAAGLLAAFATVACWFPWLDRGPRPISRFGQAISASLSNWPRSRWRGAGSWLTMVVLAVFAGVGLQRLEVRDDLRTLQNSPGDLIAQQREMGALLDLPSPAQFYLIEGESPEQVLVREESLKANLDRLVADGRLAGYAAVSDWAPSIARQRSDARLSAAAEGRVLAQVSGVVGEALQRPAFADTPLHVDDWLRHPVSEPFRSRWLGEHDGQWASLLLLDGIGPDSDLELLAAQSQDLQGVRWVDRTGDISRLLASYRERMTWLLLAGFVAVGLTLLIRYRRMAWRALLPTGLAIVLSVAALGWLGEPFQLFNALALLLLLGMGVDYGIFLVEHQGDGASWLAISLGAASTLLAFGLLALSATPALHGFGLTMLFGVGAVWLLSPFFRPPAPPIVTPSNLMNFPTRPNNAN